MLVCLFTLTVRYSVDPLGIQTEKVMNIGVIKIHSIIHGICLFTVTVRHSARLFVIQIVKVMNTALIYVFSIIYDLCLFTLPVVIHLVSSLFKS